jgi:GNAT superfamily N-acetyltransferase
MSPDRRADRAVRPLDPDADRAGAARVIYASADYLTLVNGEPPNERDVAEFFTDVAPGRDVGEMLKLGIESADGRLVGVADVAPGYPGPDTWYIGLLLLEPSARGSGAGRRAFEWISTAARGQGARRILISVLEENAAALDFWRHLGFVVLQRLEPRRFRMRDHARYELERRL